MSWFSSWVKRATNLNGLKRLATNIVKPIATAAAVIPPFNAIGLTALAGISALEKVPSGIISDQIKIPEINISPSPGTGSVPGANPSNNDSKASMASVMPVWLTKWGKYLIIPLVLWILWEVFKGKSNKNFKRR